MNSASMVAHPACKDGNAPNGIGDAVKVDVYRSMPNNWSIRASPAGDPAIEKFAGARPYMFSYHGGEQGNNSCIETPTRFMYPKLRAKADSVPGAAKTNMIAEQTNGAPKCIMPYGSHAIRFRLLRVGK